MNNVILGRCKIIRKSYKNRLTWHMKTVILKEDQSPETITVIGIPSNSISDDYNEGDDLSVSGQLFHKENNGQLLLYVLVEEVGTPQDLGQNMVLLKAAFTGQKVLNKMTGRQEIIASYETNTGNSASVVVDIFKEEEILYESGQQIFIAGALMIRKNEKRTILKILATTISKEKGLTLQQKQLTRVEQGNEFLYVKDVVLSIDNLVLAD